MREGSIVIVSGGTGGHLYPALAVAQELRRLDPNREVVFLGTEEGLERTIIPLAGFSFVALQAGKMAGQSGKGRFQGLMRSMGGFAWAWRWLEQERPALVVGAGGFVAGPTLLAARLWGLTTAVMEQNALLGMTNRILAPLVDRVFLSFPATLGVPKIAQAEVCGNPVRPSLIDSASRAEAHRSPDLPSLLVFGGSQGAHRVNELMVQALPLLKQRLPKLRVMHVTGQADLAEVAKAYRDGAIRAEVYPFLEDMGQVLGRAHLTVCRSGATTLAELTAVGRASLLIPYPYAAADHQVENARRLVAAGAAVMHRQERLTPSLLAKEIASLLDDGEGLREMEKAARRLGRPDAAARVARSCINLAQRRS